MTEKPPWGRVLLGVLGIGSLGTGAAAVFVSTNGTGTGVLIAFGGVAVILVLLGDGAETFRWGIIGHRAVRHATPDNPERTHALDQVVAKGRQLAAGHESNPSEVLDWLRGGNEEQRITALAMMEESPRLRNLDAVLAAVKVPRSAFEQYHALLVAQLMLVDLDAADAQRIADVVSGMRFDRGSDRAHVRERILVTLHRLQQTCQESDQGTQRVGGAEH
jgi:hypothetical protein